MSSRVLSVALLGIVALAGCSAPSPAPTASPTAEAATESPSPTPTGAVATGFTVPTTCADLVSPAMDASLATRGAGKPESPFAEMALGDPFMVGDPAGQGLDTGSVTDYLYCTWGEIGGPHVEVMLAAVDPGTRGPWSNEITYWEFGVSRTADGLTWSTDGDVTDNQGRVTDNIGYAGYWILREHSMIQVGVVPGSPAALAEAKSIEADIVATTGAD